MFRGKAWPLRARMTLLTCSAMAATCLAAGILVIGGIRNEVISYERHRTEEVAHSVLHQLERGRLRQPLDAPHGILVQVVDARGRVVASVPELAGRPPMAAFQPTEDTSMQARTLCPPRGVDRCMDVLALRVYDQPGGDWTIYAADDAVPWYTSGVLVAFLIALSLTLLLLTAIGTARTVDRTLAPVEAIRAELAEITASDTGRRVPVPKTRDEIRLLAETVNATLARLDASLTQMRRFTSDASHDLRTPIAAARAQVEEALLYPEETDWPVMAIEVLHSLDRLQAIVTDLLELAALDAGAKQPIETVDLAALVTNELDRRPRRVPVTTSLASGVTVLGEPLRLSRLLTNLLDNAERHAVSEVRVTVRTEDRTAVLEVLDDGSGIPPEHRELVFQRFTRLDTARNRDSGGTGLGLPIARQTAQAHGGTLDVEDSPKGARLVLRLPLHTPSGD
ncbi:sensor histidine kinase [Thermomonospora amylolytica]|uniref:sensor histidine kinase n=1 Tax=Thermomonospora amylolytica TaxID=1411117 RepID=UPI0022789E0D|nr:HAMP domain-containing sensor histidine kinase [Thermomonospora amylolytica]